MQPDDSTADAFPQLHLIEMGTEDDTVLGSQFVTVTRMAAHTGRCREHSTSSPDLVRVEVGDE